MYLQQVIGAHQPDKPVFPLHIGKPGERVRRIAGAKPGFRIRDVNTAVGGGDFLSRLKPAFIIRHAFRRFQRILRRYQPPDLVEAQHLQRLLTYI